MYGWTPQQIADMTPAQAFAYLKTNPGNVREARVQNRGMRAKLDKLVAGFLKGRR